MPELLLLLRLFNAFLKRIRISGCCSPCQSPLLGEYVSALYSDVNLIIIAALFVHL